MTKTAEPHEKRELEYRKGQIEFSKLVVTNLHLINAGGLLATPTISTFLEFNKAPAATKLYLIGVPAGLFASGLLLAAACAYVTYYNYMQHAEAQALQRQMALVGLEALHPSFRSAPSLESTRQERTSNLQTLAKKVMRKIDASFYLGQATGWLSAIAFIAACIFLAANME